MIESAAIFLLSACALPGQASSPHFENDILPLLGRHGCNASGCHGKAEGQGGFKLSVLGSDPDADRAAIVKEGRGRRVSPSSPDESLLLRKASGRVAHGGGVKIPSGSEDYQAMRAWIATPRTVGRTPRQRFAPALPIDLKECSELPTSPIVARQSTWARRISPDRSRSCA